MNTLTKTSPAVGKTVFLRLYALAFCFIFLFSFAVPAGAAGNSGWIEAHVSVPKGFDEHIILCFENVDTGEEYATRMSKINGYKSFFELPAGNYFFRRGFLENNDFRYSTSLKGSASNFTISANSEVALLLEFQTVYDENFGTVAKPTEPPADSAEETEPEPVVSGTEASGTGGVVQTTAPSGSSGTNKPGTEKAPEASEAPVTVTEPSSVPEETTKPVTEATAPSSEESRPAASQNSSDIESDHAADREHREEKYEEDDSDLSQEEQDPSDAADEEEDGPSLLKTILYTVIGAVLFALVVFLCAYLYRRHLEED